MFNKKTKTAYSEVTPTEVAQQLTQLQKSALVIDVREPEEYAEGHISGSKLIPLSRLEAGVAALGEQVRDQEVVVVCRSGTRSSIAAGQLITLGFSNVRNMRGGMLAWDAARLPVER